jgi:hypothetical protein
MVVTLDEIWNIANKDTQHSSWNELEKVLVKENKFSKKDVSFGMVDFSELISQWFEPVDIIIQKNDADTNLLHHPLWNSTVSYGVKVDAGTLERYSLVLKAALTAPKGETYLVAPGSYPFIDPTTGGTGPSGPPVPALGSSTGPAFAPTFSPQRGLPGMLTVQAMSVDPASVGNPAAIAAGNVRLVCKVQLNDDPTYKSAFSKAMAAATNEFGNGQKPLQNVIGGTYAVPVSALTPTRKTKRLAFQAVAPTQDGMPFSTELSAFLAAGGATPNAIVRSFADTGGKGLAGFIETLNFDWYDKATWETTPDRVAPQICKVTMVFSPIHDITPGLDHLGFNRAPVYPVGVLAPGPGAFSQGGA